MLCEHLLPIWLVYMMERKSSKINHYDIFEVIDRFWIEKIRQCPLLDEWISTKSELTPFDKELSEKTRVELDIK